jgi:hypothetical protein
VLFPLQQPTKETIMNNFKMKYWKLPFVIMLWILSAGCDLFGGSSSSDKSFAGNWAGMACGRTLTMNIEQNDTSLSGTYRLNNPDFEETFTGVISSETAPATATLTAGAGRRFEITFQDYTRFEGTFFNPGPVCSVSAVK